MQLIHADAERRFIDFTRVGLCSSVKGKKGDMTFDVSGAKMKDEAKAGDKVTVKYTEKDGKMKASSVTIGGAKTTKKTTGKSTEKKEVTTAPAPAAPAK